MTEYHKAKYYHNLKDGQVKCDLCPHNCIINEDKKGMCQVRKNIDGELYSINYGKVSSLGVDPVEKKPLYHFYPGEGVLSLGSYGCNMSCVFCQNWQISQNEPQSLKEYSPEDIIEFAQNKNLNLLAYTYSEPVVFYEYMLDTAKLASKNGIKNIMVSNGFIEDEPLQELLAYLDAANIDLKSFRDDFYKNHCQGGLEKVKNTIKNMADQIHLEVTTLIVTDLNDNLAELEELFKWLSSINNDIPLHLSRYHPAYKLDNPPTDLNFMKDAYKLAKKYLNHVYLGNAIIKNTADTYCSKCGAKLIKRKAYNLNINLKDNHCPECGAEVYGVFK